MTVQLKVNMILERGAYLPVGALVDEESLPPNLRKSRYVGTPGEVPGLVPVTFAQSEQDEEDGGSGDDDVPVDPGDGTDDPAPPFPPEPEPPPPPGSRRR